MASSIVLFPERVWDIGAEQCVCDGNAWHSLTGCHYLHRNSKFWIV
jgi:hypothetical protein